MTFPSRAEARKAIATLTSADIVIVPTTHGWWTLMPVRPRKQVVEHCAICGEAFPEFSCNAQPVADGRCCAYCDDHVVAPARAELARREKLGRRYR